jgi:hypothetical protein
VRNLFNNKLFIMPLLNDYDINQTKDMINSYEIQIINTKVEFKEQCIYSDLSIGYD